jgi:hypothetical protein
MRRDLLKLVAAVVARDYRGDARIAEVCDRALIVYEDEPGVLAELVHYPPLPVPSLGISSPSLAFHVMRSGGQSW